MTAMITLVRSDTSDGWAKMTFNIDTAPCITSQCAHFGIRATITFDDGRQEDLTTNVAGWSHGESGATNFNIDRRVRIQTGTVTDVPYIESPEFVCSDPPAA